MTTVAWLGLVRDTGWFPKSPPPHLKALYHACFSTTDLCVRFLLCAFHSLTVLPHYKSTVGGSKFTPGLTNSQTLGQSETSGGSWLQLLVCAHTPATIRTQDRRGGHLTYAAWFCSITRHKRQEETFCFTKNRFSALWDKINNWKHHKTVKHII